jgi:hypothetical protein
MASATRRFVGMMQVGDEACPHHARLVLSSAKRGRRSAEQD